MRSGEFRERLVSLAAGADIALAAADVDQLEAYYQLLSRWNRRINLTALPLEPLDDAALARLLIEPLAAARYVPESRLKWVDVGSGGGSPAIPLKIVRPLARLTLIEARIRKAAFLSEIVGRLGLTEVSVVNARFEDVAARYDSARVAGLVTVRAVKADKALFCAAEAVLQPDGQLFLFGAQNHAPELVSSFGEVRRLQLLPAKSSTLFILKRSTWNAESR